MSILNDAVPDDWNKKFFENKVENLRKDNYLGVVVLATQAPDAEGHAKFMVISAEGISSEFVHNILEQGLKQIKQRLIIEKIAPVYAKQTAPSKYTKIAPLGKRNSVGTFDDFYNDGKYNSMQEAWTAIDFVVVDFVQDEQGVIYFELYNKKAPEVKKYHRLRVQHFPMGIDVFDDRAAEDIAKTLY